MRPFKLTGTLALIFCAYVVFLLYHNVESKPYTGVNYVDVAWFGAKPDGITSGTTAIQNAINSLGSEGGTIFFASGTSYYKIDDTIVSSVTNTTLLFEKGAEIYISGVSKTLLKLNAPHNTVDGGTFRGYGAYQTSGSGGASLISATSDYATIRNCHLKEPEQYGIYVSGDYVTIENNVIEGGKYMADSTIIGTDRQHYGISHATGSDYSKIINNTIRPNTNTNVGSVIQGIQFASVCKDAVVSGNKIGNTWDHCIYGVLEKSVISNNICTGSGIKIQLRSFSDIEGGNVIQGNIVDVNDVSGPLSGDIGITVDNANQCVISDNVIRRSQDAGISFTSTLAPYVITGNIIKGNMIDNVVDGAGSDAVGIVIDDSDVTEYSRNIITGNAIMNIGTDLDGDQNAIKIKPSDTDNHKGNVISNNSIYNTYENGMLLYYLTSSIISGNILEKVGQGAAIAAIQTYDLTRCKFENNMFIGDSGMDYAFRDGSAGTANEYRNNTAYSPVTSIIRSTGFGGTNLVENNSLGLSGVTTYSTNGNRTIGTNDMFAAVHIRDPNGGDRTDTFPTAANIIANVIPVSGSQRQIKYINSGDTETITIAFGSGCTVYSSGGGNIFTINPYHSAILNFVNDSGTTVFVLGTIY